MWNRLLNKRLNCVNSVCFEIEVRDWKRTCRKCMCASWKIEFFGFQCALVQVEALPIPLPLVVLNNMKEFLSPHFRESQRNLNFEKFLKIMEFTADLIANYIRTGCSLLLLFIVLVMRDRNKFITLHTLLHLGFGIGFAFFPHICYGIQVCAFITIISLSYMLHYQKSTG